MTSAEREMLACKVCGNLPEDDGMIEHGRGCYVVCEDGGGVSYVEVPRATVQGDLETMKIDDDGKLSSDLSLIGDDEKSHPAWSSFAAEVRGRAYGNEALGYAWSWYRAGWDRAKETR